MKRIAWIPAVALAVTLLGCPAPAPSFTEQDAAAVRAVFDSVVVDVRAARWDVWGARFAPDARFHPLNAPALVGRGAIVAWARSLPPVDSLTFSGVTVAGAGNLAYGSSAVRIKLRDLPADTEEQLVVFSRDSTGHWLVKAVSLASDMPPPPAPPAPRH